MCVLYSVYKIMRIVILITLVLQRMQRLLNILVFYKRAHIFVSNKLCWYQTGGKSGRHSMAH